MIRRPTSGAALAPLDERAESGTGGRVRRHALVVLIAVAACYANALAGPFLFDDTQPQGAFSWRARPLTWLTFALDRRLWGADTLGYHALNVAVHAASALLLLAFVRRALAFADGLAPRTRDGLALVTALCWAVHPLQTESVSYISQRAESLASFFYLAFLYAFVRSARAARPWRWQAAALLALALGFATKEVVATAPILAWVLERTLLGRAGSSARTRRAFHLALGASWLALLGVYALRPLLAERSTSGFGVPDVTPLEYLCSQPGVIVHYLRLALWPHPLCLDYAWPVARGWREIVPPGALVLALLALTLQGLRARAWYGLAGAWFFVILAPTSSVVPIRDLAVEHRVYLALAAPVFAGVLGAWRLCARLGARASGALATVVVLALAGATVRRNRDYGSAIAMWRSVLACNPTNARAYENLSGPLIEAGRTDEAIEALNTALRLAPSALAYNNLAAIQMDAGKLDDAIATLTRAIVEDPSYDVSYANLGNCYLRRGEPARALAHFERALARLDSPYARRGLGLALLELDPSDGVARAALARAQAPPARSGGE